MDILYIKYGLLITLVKYVNVNKNIYLNLFETTQFVLRYCFWWSKVYFYDHVKDWEVYTFKNNASYGYHTLRCDATIMNTSLKRLANNEWKQTS